MTARLIHYKLWKTWKQPGRWYRTACRKELATQTNMTQMRELVTCLRCLENTAYMAAKGGDAL